LLAAGTAAADGRAHHDEEKPMSTLAAVWLDHDDAKIFHFDADDVRKTEVKAHHHHVKSHRDRAVHGDTAYFKEVAHRLAEAGQILVVGPGTAKLELLRYMHAHEPALERKVVAVETLDHPTDPQLVAFAKRSFHVLDKRA
jgi:stalled ribosome rescue protein Dom34